MGIDLYRSCKVMLEEREKIKHSPNLNKHRKEKEKKFAFKCLHCVTVDFYFYVVQDSTLKWDDL